MQEDITFEVTVPDYGEHTKLEAFMFDNMSSIKPLFEAVSANVIR